MRKKQLLFIILIVLKTSLGSIAQTIPSYVPTNGLMGWWPFNGNANDESGNGNHGVVNGAILTTDRFGISGKAFDFDGISNDIVVQNSNSLNITGTELSISYWLYYQNPTTQYTFKGISKGGWDAQGGYELIFRGGPNNSSLEINGAGGGTYCESINQYSNQWINIVAIVNNGINKIYINGIEQITLTTGNGLINLSASSLPLYFGRREPLNSYAGFLDGKLDDIGIWNRALTQQEINNVYQGSLPQNACLQQYVPTNGLVGWWPFCGNANDESGNGHNGTVNGATITTDRFGATGSAYSYSNTTTSLINFGNSVGSFSNDFCISLWYVSTGSTGYLLNKRNDEICSQNWWVINPQGFEMCLGNGSSFEAVYHNFNFQLNSWHHLLVNRIGYTFYLYVDGTLVSSRTTTDYYVFNNQASLLSGITNAPISGYVAKYTGKIDDIGIWNRALTQQEITNIYSAQLCNINAIISPASNTVNVGANNQFTATTTDPSAIFQWQTNPNNIGWQNVPNNIFYTGATTSSITVNNVQLGNHNQPFRVIATSGNCIDTSNVAFIQITDTCVNSITVYDTMSVTDTLFIYINTVGLNNNTIVNTIKVFPNPSNSILNLHYGNYATLNNYRVKITNALIQIIYDQAITQQTETIDLSSFGGVGIYYLSIINSQGNVVEVRKIVLQ
jgi:hypothetical protein